MARHSCEVTPTSPVGYSEGELDLRHENILPVISSAMLQLVHTVH